MFQRASEFIELQAIRIVAKVEGPGGSNRGKSPGADQLGADTTVVSEPDEPFTSKESPPPPRLAQPRAAAALTEEP